MGVGCSGGEGEGGGGGGGKSHTVPGSKVSLYSTSQTLLSVSLDSTELSLSLSLIRF